MKHLNWQHLSIGYIAKDRNDKLFFVKCKGFIPEGAICEAPKLENGKYYTDVENIAIRTVNGVKEAYIKKGAPLPLKQEILAKPEVKAEVKLPSLQDFIIAYFDEKDGNPAKMQELFKNYVLNKRNMK